MAEFYPTCSKCGRKSKEPMDGHPMACLICPECSGAKAAAAEKVKQLDPATLRARINALEERIRTLEWKVDPPDLAMLHFDQKDSS